MESAYLLDPPPVFVEINTDLDFKKTLTTLKEDLPLIAGTAFLVWFLACGGWWVCLKLFFALW